MKKSCPIKTERLENLAFNRIVEEIRPATRWENPTLGLNKLGDR